jgi:hypothetical protein
MWRKKSPKVWNDQTYHHGALPFEKSGGLVSFVAQFLDSGLNLFLGFGRTEGWSLMTLDTVMSATPANFATSRIVGILGLPDSRGFRLAVSDM